jgi:hypothetical protein
MFREPGNELPLDVTHADLVLPSFTHTPLSKLLATSAPGESVDIFPGRVRARRRVCRWRGRGRR